VELLVQQATFTGFRPAFIVLLVISLIFLGLSIIPTGRNSQLNFLTIVIVSVINVIVTAVLFFTESEMVQTLALAADDVTLYLFIAILVVSIANPFLFRLRNRNGSRNRYRY
jgi:uncharacterized membrane protein YcaP (DUF421 family)